MLMHNNPRRYAEDILVAQGDDANSTPVLHSFDGYQCLEAFGDDLSLEDAPLVEVDDFLLS